MKKLEIILRQDPIPFDDCFFSTILIFWDWKDSKITWLISSYVNTDSKTGTLYYDLNPTDEQMIFDLSDKIVYAWAEIPDIKIEGLKSIDIDYLLSDLPGKEDGDK